MSMKRIVFLPETKTSKSVKTVYEDSPSLEIGSHLTGDEARSFYEDLVLKPLERSTGGSSRMRKLPSKKSAEWTSKGTDRGRTSGSSVSEGDLFFYVQNNQLSQLKEALERDGSVIDTKDNFQWSLLMVAAFAGHRDMVELLLGMGAKWEGVVDRKGLGAMELARLGGFPDLADVIEMSKRRVKSGDSPGHNDVVREEIIDRSREVGSSKKTPQYTCDCCRATIADRSRSRHTTSTVHLFNCQFGHRVALSYGISERNRGYQMLLRGGWDPERGLGPNRQGNMFPVKTVLKQDRSGLGGRRGRARITHFSAHDQEAVKTDREKHRTYKSKKKRELVKDRNRERQWEIRTRAMLNS